MATALKEEAKLAATGPAEHMAGCPTQGIRIAGHIEGLRVPTMGARDDPAPVVVEIDAGGLHRVCHDGPLLSCCCRVGTPSCLLIGISAPTMRRRRRTKARGAPAMGHGPACGDCTAPEQTPRALTGGLLLYAQQPADQASGLVSLIMIRVNQLA